MNNSEKNAILKKIENTLFDQLDLELDLEIAHTTLSIIKLSRELKT